MRKRYVKTIQRIVFPAVLAGIVFLSLVVFAELGLNTVNALMSDIVDQNAERTVLALGALDNINLATIKEKNTLLEKDAAHVAKNMSEYSDLMRHALEKLEKLETITPFNELAALAVLTDLATQYRDLTERMVFPLIKLGRMDQASALSFKEGEGGGRMLRQTVRAGLEKIVEADKNEMNMNRRKAETASARTKNLVVLVALTGLALALVWISVVQMARAKFANEGVLTDETFRTESEDSDQKEKVAVITEALEAFKNNAAEAKRLAEAEEKDCERLLESMKSSDQDQA